MKNKNIDRQLVLNGVSNLIEKSECSEDLFLCILAYPNKDNEEDAVFEIATNCPVDELKVFTTLLSDYIDNSKIVGPH